jgi:hypothetical protein
MAAKVVAHTKERVSHLLIYVSIVCQIFVISDASSALASDATRETVRC